MRQIPTEFQLVDILTKALQVNQFESCLNGLLEDAGCERQRDLDSVILRKGARPICE